MALLASVHPALLLLPLLAVPSVWAGSRANAITEKAKEDTAERVRLEEHLFTVLTTPGPAKESRVFNVAGELVDRHRRLWSRGHRGRSPAPGCGPAWCGPPGG